MQFQKSHLDPQLRPLRRLTADDMSDLEAARALIQDSFAYMETRVDPPSSVRELTLDAVLGQTQRGEIWCLGTPVVACVFLTPRADCLYLGKLAVAAASRGMGASRILVEHACDRARQLGYAVLELQVRIELVENQAAFARLGFVQTAETSHPGFLRPTSLTLQRRI